jgi:hypothetical protein
MQSNRIEFCTSDSKKKQTITSEKIDLNLFPNFPGRKPTGFSACVFFSIKGLAKKNFLPQI